MLCVFSAEKVGLDQTFVHLPATKDMHMEVRDGLPRIGALVGYDAESTLIDTLDPGDLTGGGEDSGHGLSGNAIRDVRSEERRVGKECRSRWSPYH